MNIHDVYRPFLRYFRRRRMKAFAKMFPLTNITKVIDVGGYKFNWLMIDNQPNVLFVNLENEHWREGRFEKVCGDGRSLEYDDNTFDIAFSNSVIEHVGNWEDQLAFANEIRRVANSYYVQTPNKWFFIEPHLIAPFLHWFSESVRIKLARYCSVWGWVTKPSAAEVEDFIKSINLLDKKRMHKLFPDAEILEEKFLGATKSLIAVRR